jgi:outer membrane protein TolC
MVLLSLMGVSLGCQSPPYADLIAARHAPVSPATPPQLPNTEAKDKESKTEKDKPYVVQKQAPSISTGVVTPAIPSPETVREISLTDCLDLAGIENPTIRIAEQEVQSSLALQAKARALLLPSLTIGANYHLHNGPFQGSVGVIRKVDSQSLYYGFGARTLAAETVAYPGLWLFAHLGDAIYEPLVARQVVSNRQFTATATRNQVLLDVATRYLALLQAEGRLAVLRQSEMDFQEVVRLTANFAATGQGLEANADRARTDLLLLQFQERGAQEEVAVAAAELARLLNLDPETRLQTGNVPIRIVRLVDPNEPLPELIQLAVRTRPEAQAASTAIAASRTRLRQEKTRPFLPLLSIGYSAGNFGGGAVASSPTFGRTDPPFGNFSGRTDFDAYAIWTLQNAGFGNLAQIKERRAELEQAQAERQRIVNEVEREVADAYNLSASRLRELQVAQRRVRSAIEGFQRDLNRIRALQGLPIEVLNSAELLVQARQTLLRAILGYNESQFQLFVALGQPPPAAFEYGQ